MSKFLKIMFLVSLAVFMAASAGCKKQTPKRVNTKHLQPKTVEQQDIEAFGIVKAKETVDVTLDIPARIIKVFVKEGQKVVPGQPLMKLDFRDYESQIHSKLQELTNARFELLKSDKDLKDARADYEKAQKELSVKEKLYQEGAISKQDVDDYRDVLKTKEKAITDLQLSLNESDNANSLIAVKKERIANLEAEIARMRAKMSQSPIRGQAIVATMNGVVFDLGYVAGDSVSVEKKVLSIMDLSGLRVDADVSEEFIKDVKIGAAVTIVPVADNTRKYRGAVVKIAGMATKQNGETTVAVEIAILQPDQFLQPNYNVDVQIAK